MKSKRVYSLLKTGKELYEMDAQLLNHYYSEYLCIARYCKFELGMKNKEIEDVLWSKEIGVMQEQKEKKIEDVIKRLKKSVPLNSTTSVIILPHEVECLKMVEERKYRKLFFALLVIAKWESNGFYFGNKTRANVLGKMRMGKKELNLAANTITYLFENLTDVGKNDTYWNFNNLPKFESNYEQIIVDVYNAMDSFPEFCNDCGKIYRPRNNRQEFCDDCKKKREIERVKNWRKNRLVTL